MDSWNPGFPVYIYQKGMELPNEGIYFVVAGNGLWMHKDTGVCQCFVPVDNISCLDDLEAEIKVNVTLPKIPFKYVWMIKEFFRRVVEEHHSEAEINLYYNAVTQDFLIQVPKQVVSHSSVMYKRNESLPKGYICVGTIHSHCDFSAFHSNTDISDEEDFDGLHVTFGHNNMAVFTISASVVVNGYRRVVDPCDVLEGIGKHPVIPNFFEQTNNAEQQRLSELPEIKEEIDSWMMHVSKRGNDE